MPKGDIAGVRSGHLGAYARLQGLVFKHLYVQQLFPRRGNGVLLRLQNRNI